MRTARATPDREPEPLRLFQHAATTCAAAPVPAALTFTVNVPYATSPPTLAAAPCATTTITTWKG